MKVYEVVNIVELFFDGRLLSIDNMGVVHIFFHPCVYGHTNNGEQVKPTFWDLYLMWKNEENKTFGRKWNDNYQNNLHLSDHKPNLAYVIQRIEIKKNNNGINCFLTYVYIFITAMAMAVQQVSINVQETLEERHRL